MNLKANTKKNFFYSEKSLLKNLWLKKDIDERLSLNISQKFSFSKTSSNLISSRCLKIENVKDFLNPSVDKLLPDPLIFHDMKKAANKLFEIIKKKEKIAILGDYDVDGLTSVVLLKNYIEYYDLEVFTYIPDRIKEGYGPNIKAIETIKSKNINLLILVDCGTNSRKTIEYARKLKIDVIIIDHHKTEEIHNGYYSLINPNSPLDTSNYGFLCSAGLVYIFLNYLNRIINLESLKNKKKIDIKNNLDLVALATVCDVVPLISINRAFVYEGLKILSKRQNLGLKTLSDESQLNKKPDEEDLGFFFGPRLNAGGRVGNSSIGEELLSIKNEEEAEIIVKKLNTLNYQRKLIEEKVYIEAIDQIKSRKIENNNLILVINDNWHEGVLGIVASRLKEKFQKPVIILTKNNDLYYKGSGRSVLGIDIGDLIIQAKKKKIIVRGGGHSLAAGLTLEENKIKIFNNFCNNYIFKFYKSKNKDKVLKFDEILSINAINDDLYFSIEQISPFGEGNPKPKFLFQNIKIIKPVLVGNPKKHLSFFISDNSSKTLKAMLFNANDNLLGETILTNYKKNLFTFIGFVKKSFWKNKTYFETIIEDGVLEKVII